MKDAITHYGKYAATAVVGVGLGAAGFAAYDTPVQQTDKYQNLQDKVDNLNDRPTQDELNELQDEVDSLEDRPTQEELTELRNQLSNAFTQEEVNEMVADATEKEDVFDFLPVVADEDVEVTFLHAAEDRDATEGNLETFDRDAYGNVAVSLDSGELDDEFDQVRATYEHEDGHTYQAVAREFEDSEAADEYEEELEDGVDDAEFDENIRKDAQVIRDGDTVLYLYGEASDTDELEDYDSYNFDQVASQYE